VKTGDNITTFDFNFIDGANSTEGLYNVIRNTSTNKYYTSNITPAFTTTVRLEEKGNSETGVTKEIKDDIWYTCKTMIYKDTMYMKVWERGTEEPIKWDVTRVMSDTGSNDRVFRIEYYAAGKNVLVDNVSVSTIKLDSEKETQKPKVTNIKLNATSKTLTAGDKFKLVPTITPSNADKTVSYQSGSSKYAKVDENGTVTALKAGKATITVNAKDGSGKSAKCVITVKSKVSKVSIIKNDIASNQNTIYMVKGKTLKITAKITPSSAIQSVKWTSSKPSVVKVSNGKLTAKKTGNAIIKVASTSNSKMMSKIKVVVVKKSVKAKSIKFQAKSYKVKVGKTIQLKTIISPKKTTDRVNFSSDNKKIAKVNNKTGIVTGIKKGTAKITVKTSSGAKKTVKINVLK